MFLPIWDFVCCQLASPHLIRQDFANVTGSASRVVGSERISVRKILAPGTQQVTEPPVALAVEMELHAVSHMLAQSFAHVRFSINACCTSGIEPHLRILFASLVDKAAMPFQK